MIKNFSITIYAKKTGNWCMVIRRTKEGADKIDDRKATSIIAKIQVIKLYFNRQN